MSDRTGLSDGEDDQGHVYLARQERLDEITVCLRCFLTRRYEFCVFVVVTSNNLRF
jgi:hypothetical protein